jgi:uncharacterized membrane protein
MSESRREKRIYNIILMAQILMMSFFWVFVFGITLWLVNLLLLSIELNDMPGFSMAISLVAISVFWTLAAVLTYVFVGLRRNRMTD